MIIGNSWRGFFRQVGQFWCDFLWQNVCQNYLYIETFIGHKHLNIYHTRLYDTFLKWVEWTLFIDINFFMIKQILIFGLKTLVFWASTSECKILLERCRFFVCLFSNMFYDWLQRLLAIFLLLPLDPFILIIQPYHSFILKISIPCFALVNIP